LWLVLALAIGTAHSWSPLATSSSSSSGIGIGIGRSRLRQQRLHSSISSGSSSLLTQDDVAAADDDDTRSSSESETRTPRPTTTTTTTTTPSSSSSRIIADDADFVKPDRDRRLYRTIQLHNNLQVLLVSTQLTPGSTGIEAASVHVQAGHFDDTIPGLAHFHEHLLFLGTQKYPDEDEYESYLQRYGGHSNAYTDMEDTNYYFSITTEAPPAAAAAAENEKNNSNNNGSTSTEGLYGALDRLAQFFISPKFDADVSDREINAIDSEYRNGLTSESWRNFQLIKSTCHPDHPFAKFGCGNKETLTSQGLDALLQELHTFWDKYYQTYNLRLAVVGHGSLDSLQATVEQTFGQLPVSTGEPRRLHKSRPNQLFTREHAVYNVPAFSASNTIPTKQLGRIRRIKPLSELRSIKLLFVTPPLDDPRLDASKPYRTISHLLGHESPGSLHALLNEQGYIQGLSSGIGIDTSDFSLFSLSVALTPKGWQEKQNVLDLVFQWIALLRDNQDKLYDYHQELKQLTTTNFRFRENGDPTDFCSTASELLFEELDEPGRLLVVQSETAAELEPEIVSAFFERLRPENCMISVHSSDFDDTVGEWQREKWYGATYQEEDIAPEQLKLWEHPPKIDSRLHLPKLNEYIPTDFSLRCDDNSTTVNASTVPPVTEEELHATPELLIDTPQLRLWHKMDRYWRVPKAFIKLALLSPKIYSTPRTMTYSRIFQRVLNDDLNSFVYDASVAGCSYRITSTPSGYRMSVQGYSEKLPFLLDTLTTRIMSLIEEMKVGNVSLKDKFEKAKESLLRETKNYRMDPPYEVANYNSRLLMEENVYYLDNYIVEMEGEDAERDPLTMGECAVVVQECFTGRVQCEALCMGNIDEAGARVVAEVIDRHFLATSRGLCEAEMPRFRSMMLPDRETAQRIFGEAVKERPYPVVYQDIAFSETEANNAVEVILQAGCEFDLGYEGVAILDLITHMAYNSAYNQLRTKEQLGYIVSASGRKTAGGAWGMTVVVQGSVALPDVLEERIEAWIALFRQELEDIDPEEYAAEASGVVAQLMEKDHKLSQEASRTFGEILSTEGYSNRIRKPVFNRLELLAAELTVASDDEGDSANGDTEKSSISSSLTPKQLKDRVLQFFDKHFSPDAPQRRAMSARVYNQNAREEYNAHVGKPGILSSYSDMRHLKLYLSSWPNVPYWAKHDAS
jgi:insulysin